MFLPENQHECVGLMVSPGNHVSVCEHGYFNRLLYIDGLSLNYGLVGTIVSDEPNNFFFCNSLQSYTADLRRYVETFGTPPEFGNFLNDETGKSF